jgi:hypothetical protein
VIPFLPNFLIYIDRGLPLFSHHEGIGLVVSFASRFTIPPLYLELQYPCDIMA